MKARVTSAGRTVLTMRFAVAETSIGREGEESEG
jgi:hypothetical protein